MRGRASSHPIHRYAEDVVAGRIVAGKWVKLACQNHLTDMEDGHKRGLTFDLKAAQHHLDFAQYCKHSKGEWGGQTLTLEPWQQFCDGNVYGWKREDGLRRYRFVYEEVARKNGKSTRLAFVGNYGLIADREPGAEIYAAATKRDQARIVWDEARRMVLASPALRQRVQVYPRSGGASKGAGPANLSVLATSSKFEPLGRDADTMDGLNIHMAIVDELHAHKTREVLDVLDTATGSRRQPIIWCITTAGYDRNSVCWEQHEYAEKVLQGIVSDDSFFAYMAAIDPEDDWEDEACWIKANPNLGVSVKLDDLQRKAAKAKQSPASLNGFLRLHLNVWTDARTTWISDESWMTCATPVDLESLRGRRCYGGLDLAKTRDISSLVLYFPPVDDQPAAVLGRHWIPEEDIVRRSHLDRVPYEVWKREGLVRATPGNVVDYGFIQREILDCSELYDMHEIGYDRHFANELVTALMDELGPDVMVPFGQGYVSMAAPVEAIERLVLGKQIAHGADPVLRWMMSNVTIIQDPAGNKKLDKSRSRERIDGIVALAMAIGRAMVHGAGGGPRSKYEEEGLLVY